MHFIQESQSLRAHREDNLTVIIDDLSRLAREMEAHIHLRTAIAGVGAKSETNMPTGY